MHQVFIGKMKYKIIGFIIEYYYLLWYIIENKQDWSKKMNYKIDLSEQNQNLLINADVKVEDREYSVDEIKKDIAEISSYIMSKSSKNGDIAKAQAEYMPLINVLQKNII